MTCTVSNPTLLMSHAIFWDTHSCLNAILDIGDCLSTADSRVGGEVFVECGLIDGRRAHGERIVKIGVGCRGENAVDVTVTSTLPDRLMDREDSSVHR